MSRPRLLLIGLIGALLIAGGMGLSWMILGYWWNPFSPCQLAPERSYQGEIRPPWLLPFGTEVIEDQGQVCFAPARFSTPPANQLQAQVYSSGCYSHSCSLVYERSGQIEIDQAVWTTQLTARFAIKRLEGQRMGANCACTTDCGGAGVLEFGTKTLQDGTYQVYLGETLVGVLTIPFEQDNLCLDTDHPVQIEAVSPQAYPPPIPLVSTAFPAAPYPEPDALTPGTSVTPVVNATAVALPPQPIWYSPVITVPLPITATDKIQTGEWLSATRLQVTTQESRSGGLYWIDLGAGDPLIYTPRPASPNQQAYSASSLYSVQCGNPLQMIDVANQAVISQADLILNPSSVIHCSGYVSWIGGEVTAFAARANGVWSTYLWLPDGSPPIRVGPALNGARPPAWSPDGEQFAFLTPTDTQPLRLQLTIADRSGRLLQTLPTSLVLQPTEFRWIGRQVLALRNSNNLWQYYQAQTGELLFTWQEALSMGSTRDHQYPQISPDGRWFPIERDGSAIGGISQKSYRLFDIQNRQEILLYDRPWHLLEFSGWSPDGERLYMLHLPAGPDAAADPGLPFGLLEYHPTGGQFELLVENAQAVYWDANYQKALVSVFVQDSTGQATLTAGIWDRSTNQVVGAVPITTPPTQYDFLLHPYSMNRWVPAAWSPDGRQVAFFTWQGDLLLMGLDGQTQLLASQVGLGRSDFTRLLAWAPDDARLFVSDRGTAWIVTIPLLP